MSRLSRDMYFLVIAKAVSLRSTCDRRKVGCVLVDVNYHILSTGYNGPASGLPHCTDVGCARKDWPSGTALETCGAIHAEQNALLQCGNTKAIYTAYITHSPCVTCVKLFMNTGCRRLVFSDPYPHNSEQLWNMMGREWIHLPNRIEIMEKIDGDTVS